MTGRPKTEHSELVRFRTRPESVLALNALAASTGLARSHLLRLAVDRWLLELGLVAPADLTPTRITHSNREDK